MSYDIRWFLIPKLRRYTSWWPPRREVIKAAKIARNQYTCACCGNIFPSKEIVVDHINPIVPTTAEDFNWHTYITGMFCPAEGLQVLCKPCHADKTKKENSTRDASKKSKVKARKNVRKSIGRRVIKATRKSR